MKRLARTLCFALTIMLCQFGLISAKASVAGLHSYTSEESVFSKVLVYHQATTQQREWQGKLLGGKTTGYTPGCTNCGKEVQPYMGHNNASGGTNKCSSCGASLGWGCGIYAMAHALQWAGGFAMNASNGGELLDEFINTNKYPWRGSLYTNYDSVVKSHGVSARDNNFPTSEAELLEFFNNGGAIVTHISNNGGHYQCAVGIAVGNSGETWIHMLDSTCNSTIKRLGTYSAYNFSTGAVQSSEANYGGGEYWIPYAAYCDKFTPQVAMTGNGASYPLFAGTTPVNLGEDFYAYIFHQSDGLCVTDQGNNVDVEEYTGASTQRWRFQRLRNGSYTLLNVGNSSYMDVFGANTEGGSNVYAYKGDYLDIENQQFYIYHVYDAYYICPVHGKGKIAFDVNASTHNLEVYDIANDWVPQKFDIEEYYPNPTKPVPVVKPGNSIKETVISWDSVSDANSYGILIQDLNDNYVHIRWDYSKNAFSALLPAGNYKAKIVAVKESGNTESRSIAFTVDNKSIGDIGVASSQIVWNHTLYSLYGQDCSWLEAKALAEHAGGHLLTITSEEEQDVATRLVSEYGRLVFIGAEGYSSYDWKWITREPFTYQNWLPGKPDNWDGKENCGHLYTDGTWNDIGCSDQQVHGFIAEYTPVSISVTPSDELLSLLGVDYEQQMEEQTAYYSAHIREHLTVEVTFSDGSTKEVDDYGVTTRIEHDDNKPLKYEFDYTVTYDDLSDTTGIGITLEPMPVFGEPDFTLPAAISTVDESAFEGIAATIVYIPDTCTNIGKWAFKDCSKLTQIRIPAKCSIGTDAFSGCAKVVIFGTKGSAAETYANSHSNCSFVAE